MLEKIYLEITYTYSYTDLIKIIEDVEKIYKYFVYAVINIKYKIQLKSQFEIVNNIMEYVNSINLSNLNIFNNPLVNILLILYIKHNKIAKNEFEKKDNIKDKIFILNQTHKIMSNAIRFHDSRVFLQIKDKFNTDYLYMHDVCKQAILLSR